MRKITTQENFNIAADNTEINLSAGNGKMILEINYYSSRMPMRTFRRAMGYRKFLKSIDMPVYVYVNNKKTIRLKGKHWWIYRPAAFIGWSVRNILTT